jgi:hypothetical protein
MDDLISPKYQMKLVTAVGLFLSSYYKSHYPAKKEVSDEEEDLPF